MILLQIESDNGYKPRPDFQLRIYENGIVRYEGRYYVAVVGIRSGSIGKHELERVRGLSDLLVKRNQKNYLKKGIKRAYRVKLGASWDMEFDVDERDVISDDLISQIIEICGVRNWIASSLDLFLVLSKPNIRSRELALVRATDSHHAVTMFMGSRRSKNIRSVDDFMALCIGHQKSETIENPLIYCSFTEYRIEKYAPELFLNQGPSLAGEALEVFLYVSFGKRYNDPTASYFLVLARNISQAALLFKKNYPHFMPDDFQAVDPGIVYKPIPLFDTHIPVAIR